MRSPSASPWTTTSTPPRRSTRSCASTSPRSCTRRPDGARLAAGPRAVRGARRRRRAARLPPRRPAVPAGDGVPAARAAAPHAAGRAPRRRGRAPDRALRAEPAGGQGAELGAPRGDPRRVAVRAGGDRGRRRPAAARHAGAGPRPGQQAVGGRRDRPGAAGGPRAPARDRPRGGRRGRGAHGALRHRQREHRRAVDEGPGQRAVLDRTAERVVAAGDPLLTSGVRRRRDGDAERLLAARRPQPRAPPADRPRRARARRAALAPPAGGEPRPGPRAAGARDARALRARSLEQRLLPRALRHGPARARCGRGAAAPAAVGGGTRIRLGGLPAPLAGRPRQPRPRLRRLLAGAAALAGALAVCVFAPGWSPRRARGAGPALAAPPLR